MCSRRRRKRLESSRGAILLLFFSFFLKDPAVATHGIVCKTNRVRRPSDDGWASPSVGRRSQRSPKRGSGQRPSQGDGLPVGIFRQIFALCLLRLTCSPVIFGQREHTLHKLNMHHCDFPPLSFCAFVRPVLVICLFKGTSRLTGFAKLHPGLASERLLAGTCEGGERKN